MSYFPEFEERCRAEFGAPEGFTIVEAELVGTGRKPTEYTHCKVVGAVYEPITRGKRKGEPNWRKPVEGTKYVYYLSTSHSDRSAQGTSLCSDCPPVGYPTDKTRCTPCPRRNSQGD